MEYPLVIQGRSYISLENLYVYRFLMDSAAKESKEYASLVKQVEIIVNSYADQLPELSEEVTRLKLEIRLATRGIPVTVPMDAATATPVLQSDPNFNEQQFNAHSEVLKKAYKKVAMLSHPDRQGGSVEAFNEVTEAYSRRDLSSLTEIYISLCKGRNLYWQQSTEGISYASTEFDRPRANLQLLKTNPIFTIARYHMAGKVHSAKQAMQRYLESEIVSLLTELSHLSRN